jgi:hypothetical protein
LSIGVSFSGGAVGGRRSVALIIATVSGAPAPVRNTIAHINPVAADEQKRLEVFFNDWVELVKAKRTAIP